MKTNGQQETEKININLENLGTPNKNKVVLSVNSRGTLILFFSYKTIVGFNCHLSNGTYTEKISNKFYSNTTSRFINELEQDKSKRITEEELKNSLNECLNILFKS